MADIFSYMFTTAKTTAMDARRHEAKKALLYAKNQEPPWGQVQGGQQEQPRLLKLPFLLINRGGRRSLRIDQQGQGERDNTANKRGR